MTGLIRYESADHVATITINRADKRNAFSVGADLTEVPINFWQSAPVTGVAVSKPIVAAPFGWCVGGGFIMVQMSELCAAAFREKRNPKFTGK